MYNPATFPSLRIWQLLFRLNLISCYIFKLFLYTLGFVTSHGQVERKLPPCRTVLSPFFFLKIIITGLIVHRACNKMLTLCCETTMVNLH
uniref:Uncharacterized protein n=3 Tax=Canis lupus TaxID=9612 RepID=A0A8C0YZ61_CANLF